MIGKCFRTADWYRHPGFVFFVFILSAFLIRIFLRGSLLELDEAEQVVTAQNFSAGYPNQPPLYSWLQYGFFRVFGVHLYSLALLKYSLLFAVLYSYYQIAHLHCENKQLAWCATLAWVLIPAISFDLLKDNTHSILALLTACLTWYWFIYPSRLISKKDYLIFGCIIGTGLLSKFNYLLFFFILIISALATKACRYKIYNRYFLLSLLMALLISSPYFLWLFSHAYVHGPYDSIYKLIPAHKSRFQGAIELIKTVFFFVSPVLFIAKLFFPVDLDIKKTSANELLDNYHLICPPFLLSFLVILGIRDFQTRWLIPILFLCPLLFFTHVKWREQLKLATRYFLMVTFCIQLAILAVLIARSHLGNKKYNHYPLAETIEAIRKEGQAIDYLVADPLSHWLLGNLLVKIPLAKGWLLHPSISPSLPPRNSLLVWQGSLPPPLFYQLSSTPVKWTVSAQDKTRIIGRTYLSGGLAHNYPDII